MAGADLKYRKLPPQHLNLGCRMVSNFGIVPVLPCPIIVNVLSDPQDT
jgi:hypothetical protein